MPSLIKSDLNLLLMPAEPMIINGLKLDLGMALTEMSIAECLKYFNSKYKDLKLKINNSAFLVSFKNDKNEIVRYYFFQDKPQAMTNCFYMTIPQNAPKKPANWPKNIPRANGIAPIQTIELPNRKNSMARFKYVGNKDAVINDLNRKLTEEGYIAMGDDPQHRRLGQTGNLFVKKDASEMVIFSLSDTGTGSILKKKLPKNKTK